MTLTLCGTYPVLRRPLLLLVSVTGTQMGMGGMDIRGYPHPRGISLLALPRFRVRRLGQEEVGEGQVIRGVLLLLRRRLLTG